jgi:HSP20 family protein
MFQWKFRTDPIWAELDRLQGSEDNLFDAAIGSAIRLSERLWSRARLFPLLNVKESNQSFVVTALIPGMKIEDLQISITGDMLTIEGERGK